MRQFYDPFVLRRFADGRIFFVNARMPFEYFLDCFQWEQPFFLVAKLDDGRIAITPNAMVIPQNFLQAGFGPFDWLPTEYEYVTIRNGTYPLLITAHPVANIDEWFHRFETRVQPFAKQTLADFITKSFDYVPIKIKAKPRMEVQEPVHT